MSFIAIDKNILINPDKIDSIEQSGKSVIVYVNGRRYTVKENLDAIIKGSKEIDLTNQFWAGR